MHIRMQNTSHHKISKQDTEILASHLGLSAMTENIASELKQRNSESIDATDEDIKVTQNSLEMMTPMAIQAPKMEQISRHETSNNLYHPGEVAPDTDPSFSRNP